MRALRIALSLASTLLVSFTALSQCPVITISSAGMGNGTNGQSYSGSVVASPAGTYIYEATGLPATLSINPATGAITGTPGTSGVFPVRIVATNASSCVGTHVFPLQVCDVASVSIGASATTICAGTNVTFTATPTNGGPTPSYQWKLNGGNVGTNSNTYSSTTLVNGDQVTVDMTSNQTSPCVTGSPAPSNTVTMTVNANPTTPTITAGSSACANTSGLSASGPSATTWAWGITNGSIQGSTTGQTISYTAGASGTTILSLTVTNASNCQASNTANVTINPNPGLAPAATTFNALYHNGFSQTFTASSGTPPYIWGISAAPAGLTFTPGATTATLSGSAPTLPSTTTNGTTFDVTVTDSNGCSKTITYTLAVKPNTQGDTYLGGVGNTQYVITGYTPFPATPAVSSATTVIGNDVYPGPLTGLAVTGAPTHGAVSLKTDGTFLYTPNLGDTTGSDAFVYTLTDANGVTNTATVAINWSGMVWYVNDTIASTGDGRSHNPFKLLSDAQGPAAGKPQTGQTIYVHTGSGTTTGNLNLLASQRLWGNGVVFSLGSLSLASGTKPTLNGAVALGNDVTVTGLTFNPTGSAITSSGITGTSTIDQNTISANNASTTVSLATGIGTINFTSTSIAQSGSGTGLAINGKTGGTVSFDSTSTINVTGAGATGINLTTNTGATISFAGTLTLTTTTGPAFVATGGGTVTATGTGSVVSTTTATAVNVANTTIGASNLTFQSVSAGTAASGPANGIVLNNTGSSGGLVVTGTGAASSGGTIQKTSGAGASLTSTSNLSLSYMTIQNCTHDGIFGVGVNGFSLAQSSVLSNGSTNSGTTTDGGVNLRDTTGAVVFDTDNVSSNFVNNVLLNTCNGTAYCGGVSSTAAITTLTVTNGSYNAAAGGPSFLMQMYGTSSIATATVSGVTFANNVTSYPINAVTNEASTIGNGVGAPGAGTLTVSNCTFTNNQGIGPSFADAGGNSATASMYVRFVNNTLTGTHSHALNFVSGASSISGTMKILVSGNTIGNAGIPASGSAIGEGIVVTQQGKTTMTATITGNTIRGISNPSPNPSFFSGRGIDFQALGPTATGQTASSYPVNLTITGNDVNTQDNSGFPLYDVYVGADDQGSPTIVNAAIHGNTVPTPAGGPCDTQCGAAFGMIFMEKVATPGSTSTGTLFNFNGSGADVSSEIAATNPGAAGKTCSPNTALSLVGVAPPTVP